MATRTTRKPRKQPQRSNTQQVRDLPLGDRYLTRVELAKELGLTPRTLKVWRVRRVGPPQIKLGQQIVYRASAVAEWLKQREVGGSAA